MRTPKAGEHWVWLPCEKHRFGQLRDLVVEGRDFEDQPDFVQEEQLEHIRCGCRFPAEDPETALADLRRDEAQYEAQMRAKMAAILRPPERESSFSVPWLVLVILAAMAVAMYFAVFRG